MEACRGDREKSDIFSRTITSSGLWIVISYLQMLSMVYNGLPMVFTYAVSWRGCIPTSGCHGEVASVAPLSDSEPDAWPKVLAQVCRIWTWTSHGVLGQSRHHYIR